MSATTRVAVATLAVALVLLTGSAAPTGTSIPTTPHGDIPDGSIGGILALGSGTLLVCSKGVDGALQTADDKVLLVEGVGTAMPTITPLATPGLPDYSGHLVRLTATRALITCAGPDLIWKNADDVVFLLDDLGSTNTVTAITVGFLNKGDAHTTEALGPDRAVLYSLGPNGTVSNADDEAVVLTDLGGMNIVTHLAAPRVPGAGRSKPTALSPTSFLMASHGPDGNATGADDVTYLFTGVGTAAVRTDLPTPRLFSGGTGRPVRVSATRALVSSAGADGSEGTADDSVLLLDALGTMNIVTPILVGGGIYDYGASVPAPLSSNLAVIASDGPDASDGTADDGIAVISGLGTTNTVTFVTIGGMDEDGECRPSRLGPDSCAFPTGGPNNTMGGDDDQVVLLTGAGTTNTITRITVGGLQGGITSKVVPLGPDALLVSNAGADLALDTFDDAVTVISDALGTPLVEPVLVDGTFPQSYGFESVPVVLGGGRAVVVSSGPDGAQGAGGDDRIRVIASLPDAAGLTIKNAKIGFKAASPEKGEKISLKASLAVPAVLDLSGDDVTLTLGNSFQLIPAGSFVAKGKTFQYSDPQNLKGFVKKVVYNPGKRSLVIKTKGVGTGAEDTDADNVAFSFESGDTFLGQAVVGTEFAGGIKYKARK